VEDVRTDCELAAAFARSGEEAAFAELVERHGGMVYRACLRQLGDAHQAEDAAQAVFVVLARRASSLRRGASVAAWLLGVARNVSLRALEARGTRARREKEAAVIAEARESRQAELTGEEREEAIRALDRELCALPAKQRQAVVLRYLEDRSVRESAEIAGCPVGTLTRRASDGLARLRARMSRSGCAVGAAGLVALMQAEAAFMPPAALTATLCAAAGGSAGAAASSLASAVLKSMTAAKIKVAALILTAATVVGGGGALTANRLLAGEPRLAPSLKKLPANKWVQLPIKTPSPYTYGRPVFEPARGRVLHWGWVDRPYRVHTLYHNDVLAFDPTRGDWVSDYKPDGHGALATAVEKERIGIGKRRGRGGMTRSGIPVQSAIANGVCYDPKRKQVIYTMKGLMAAYDPATRKWRDMKPKTIIAGKESAGPPPVYGSGTCYDPVNDQIFLFPHFGAVNATMQSVNGNVTGHLGTFTYGFKDNTWRRITDELGPAGVRDARKAFMPLLARASRAVDGAWTMRRRPKAADAAEIRKGFAAALSGLEKLKLPAAAAEYLAKALPQLKKAKAAADGAKWEDALSAGGRAMWHLNLVHEEGLRVEPPPRTGTLPIYDPEHEVIVVFGGQNNLVRTDLKSYGRSAFCEGLNDTWLYDVKARQWREISAKNAPPRTSQPDLVYDPASKKVLLVTRTGSRRKPGGTITLWGLDVAGAGWSKLDAQDWTGVNVWSNAGIVDDVCLDAANGILLLVQARRGSTAADRNKYWQETFALKLDAARLSRAAAPARKVDPPLLPQFAPPEDPAWVAKMKSLPANTWTAAKPPRDCPTKDWGNVGVDTVRSWLYYFGGGHSTYQMNDVSVYAVGANKWVYRAGDHNDWIPPVGWGGAHRGYLGGPNACHMTNAYVAVDGRMYMSPGVSLNRESSAKKGPRSALFYDVDRGGVWRTIGITDIDLGKAPGTYGAAHVVSPQGRVLGFSGSLRPATRSGPHCVSDYDIYTGKLTIRAPQGPRPAPVGECRPFCFLTGKNRIFYFECGRARKGKTARRRTWVYDVATNSFTDLKPEHQPPAAVNGALYMADKDAVFAGVGRGGDQWVYSFEKKDWGRLPAKKGARFSTPYAQMGYFPRYGVIVHVGNANKRTVIMRPDLGAVKWE
jgi:RNA polymerase sigma-70 factor (ECF subfamily)